MRYSPRNVTVTCNHRGLTHFGGVFFFHEFLRLLQFRNFLSQHLRYPRRNQRYSVSQMVLALVYPLVLGLDRLETASLLRSNGTFQFLTGLPSFPDPQTLRRFLLHAPDSFWEQMHGVNDRLLQNFIHLPNRRSRLVFDLDSTVVTVFGHQEQAAVGYNPRYRGKRSFNPLLCIEANSSYLWDTELRPGNVSPWDGSPQLLEDCFSTVPAEVREIRLRADSGFGFNPVLETLEKRRADYAIVARMTSGLRRYLSGLHYDPVNPVWEMTEFEHRPQGWPHPRRFCVARRFIAEEEGQPTLFSMGRHVYRLWVTNMDLTPAGIWRFYEGRAAMEPRIGELRENYALRKIPTRSFPANALYLEIIRLAYNLVTAFQRTCLNETWQNVTLATLRYKLFMLPAELTRPGNRPVLRLRQSPMLKDLAEDILRQLQKTRPIRS